jgi:hypothetical protein
MFPPARMKFYAVYGWFCVDPFAAVYETCLRRYDNFRQGW